MKEWLNDDTVTICNYVYEAVVVCGINNDTLLATKTTTKLPAEDPFPLCLCLSCSLGLVTISRR